MTVSSQTAGPDNRQTASASISLSKNAHGLLSLLVRFGGKAIVKAHSALNTIQTGRMVSTLSDMSDHQLSQIGIQRSDIPKYAETLMSDK